MKVGEIWVNKETEALVEIDRMGALKGNERKFWSETIRNFDVDDTVYYHFLDDKYNNHFLVTRRWFLLVFYRQNKLKKEYK